MQPRRSSRLAKVLDTDVSAVGLGTWQLGGEGWGSYDLKEAVTALDSALEFGLNLVDTAQAYGNGRSEEIIGAALRRKRSRVILVSKVGWDGRFDAETIRSELDMSLRRLKTDYLDVYLLHSPTARTIVEGDAVYEMMKLKEKGLIRSWGIAARSHWSARDTCWVTCLCGDCTEVLKAAEIAQPDVIEVVYSALDERAAQLLFPTLKDTGVIARNVIASGLIAGRRTPGSHFAADDLRSRINGEWRNHVLQAGSELGVLAAPHSAAAVATAFAASHPDVDVSIVGCKNRKQLKEITTALSMVPLPNDMLARIREIFRLQGSPLADYEQHGT